MIRLIKISFIPMFLVLLLVGCNTRHKQQEKLANSLGVQIEDYPYPSSFPNGYFYIKLQSGMTINEIHAIVQGYENVYHCGDYSEIYYYYSQEDNKALRFELLYDEQGRFKQLRGEDDDSRTIRTEGCMPGLIDEN